VKNIVIGLICLAFVGIVAIDGWAQFSALTSYEYLSSIPLLSCLFVGSLGLYFLILGLGGKSNSQTEPVSTATVPAAVAQDTSTSLSAVIQFVSLLQERGRLLDFAMDDIAPYSDEQVGRVARVVHQGIQGVLKETLEIEPLHQGAEGDTLLVEKDFNALGCRLVGNLSKQPPLSGRVLHRGWRAKRVALPFSITSEAVKNQNIVQPIELEVT
jgi:hypothetical protein